MLFSKWKFSIIVMVIYGQVSADIERIGHSTAEYEMSSVDYGTGGMASTSFGAGLSVNYGRRGNFVSNGLITSSEVSSEGFGQNPNSFYYQSVDEQGNTHYHREETDDSGTVRGSYGYNDVQGLYRVVDYIADASGFRANIRTNEPGTDGKENPADVQMMVEQPLFGIQGLNSRVGGKPEDGRSGLGGSGFSNAIHGTFKSGISSNATEENDEYP